jgi:hypothetical protein
MDVMTFSLSFFLVSPSIGALAASFLALARFWVGRL